MQRDVVTASPDDDVESVLRLLRENELPGIPVVNDGGRCVGIVTEAELVIPAEALERNCAHLARSLTGGAALCAVVKADGYGHGAVRAAAAAQAGGATWLAVATGPEAVELREAGVEGALLVMGALAGEELDAALQ